MSTLFYVNTLVVVRSAIRRLAAEGIVNPRPGFGTVVLMV
ncbi:MAG: GntR family transcriptional regulator [Kiritimatiellae bacterium]|nr:GntR family transcriptional regulator [Kiritimatiellia bacterium]